MILQFCNVHFNSKNDLSKVIFQKKLLLSLINEILHSEPFGSSDKLQCILLPICFYNGNTDLGCQKNLKRIKSQLISSQDRRNMKNDEKLWDPHFWRNFVGTVKFCVEVQVWLMTKNKTVEQVIKLKLKLKLNQFSWDCYVWKKNGNIEKNFQT